MTRIKAFFITFTITFSIMLLGFVGLYWMIEYSQPADVGKNQEGVPILSLTPEDTKNILLVLECEDVRFYSILQLNAIQSRVNLVSVPSGFYLSKVQRTLKESMEYAGVRQCVQDLSEQFDIAVDYHLVCSPQDMAQLMESFDGLDTQSTEIPQSVKQYVLKGNRYIEPKTLMTAVDMAGGVLDNSVGTEFLNTAGCCLLQENLENIKENGTEALKENYSLLETDIGTQAADKLNRIVSILCSRTVQFDGLVLEDEETAQEQIDKILKE